MKLGAKFERGIRGTDPILEFEESHIVFVGRSNVGKSSLLNALTEEKELARVGDKPGKTKEINFYSTNRKKLLVDLPGYGFAEASLKERDKLKKLIIWYLTESGAKIERVVLVLDAVAGLTEFDEQMIGVLTEEELPFAIVINKIDKLSQSEIHARQSAVREAAPTTQLFVCSTRTGMNIEKLQEYLFPQSAQ